jgi:hypothetical protein
MSQVRKVRFRDLVRALGQRSPNRIGRHVCLACGCVVSLIVLVTNTPYAVAESGNDAKAWRHVKRWLVEAESMALPAAGKEVASPTGVNLSHRIVVATSDNQMMYFVGHPYERLGIDWKNEPFDLDLRIRDERLIKHYKFNRLVTSAEFRRGAIVPDFIRQDALFFFFPSWPLRGYPAPRIEDLGMILVVAEAVGSDQYEVTSERRVIDQERCRLIRSRSNMDRIWVSEGKDMCVIRRQWYIDKSKTTMGELTANHVTEVAPGLWIPVEVEIAYYPSNGRGETQEAIRRTRTRIIRCEVDERVPLQALDLTFQPGTIERTSAGRIKQLSPGGTEHLLEIAKFYRDRVGLPQRPQARNTLTMAILQTAAGALAGCIGGIVLRRRHHQRLP